MEASTYTAARVTETLDEPFDEVTRRIESLTGRADLPRVRELLAPGGQAEQARRAIEAMAGPSGLMVFEQFDHGRLLALAGQDRRAMLYLIGNPLIAVEMTRHNVAAGLYAPWRLLVYERGDGKTRLTYDRPASILGQFDDGRIEAVAGLLEQKLEGVVGRGALRS